MSASVSPDMMAWEVSPVENHNEDSPVDSVSLPDSAIDMLERYTSMKDSPKQKLGNLKTKKTTLVKLPDLFSSIVAQPARLNPFWKSNVPREADEWARSVMKLDDTAFVRHQKAQLPLLAAGFVPEADANGYRIVCDFMEWVFFFDDIFDEGSLREDPAAARDELEAHLAIHDHDHPEIPADDHPVRHMYQTLWRKIETVSSPGARKRYIQGMRHYFEGCMVQVDSYYWHSRGYSAATFDMFWRGRTHSVGCRPCQALLEPLHHITLPDEVFLHPMIKEAEDTATVITFLHNDILSYRKEQAEPEAVPHNTIHVLRRERGYTTQGAFDFAGELLKQAFQRWHWTQQHLPSWGEHVDIQVQRYLVGLLDQAKANLHWSFASGRYFGKDSESARKTMLLEMPVHDEIC